MKLKRIEYTSQYVKNWQLVVNKKFPLGYGVIKWWIDWAKDMLIIIEESHDL